MTLAVNCLAEHVVEELLKNGIKECSIAAGSRNSPLVYALLNSSIKVYNWSEERSAAFFALGRSQATKKPVAVVTTSGTAAAELLPACMTAHYLGLPLLLITADRPRRFRGAGAPQTAEQVCLFGCYVGSEWDVEGEETFQLNEWNCLRPAHLNVCFEEPKDSDCQLISSLTYPEITKEIMIPFESEHLDEFLRFIDSTHSPLVILGGLDLSIKDKLINFLLKLGAPFYAEGFSNLREESSLEHLRIEKIDTILTDYPIDGILRIGSLPTVRLWRDLEDKTEIKICSISEQPFSGLSWASVVYTSLEKFFQRANELVYTKKYELRNLKNDLSALFIEEPYAEPSLIHTLSERIPKGSFIYLGNSLPIREWDLAATYENRNFYVCATRGINGIDGQVSTFLGLCSPTRENWCIIGDLTLLYDMVGPWILQQLQEISINIVVVNNQGGKIFSRLYSHPIFQNPHQLNFSNLATFWNMDYERWTEIPKTIKKAKHRLIEIVPDNDATNRFWETKRKK